MDVTMDTNTPECGAHTTEVDLSEEKIHWQQEMSYSAYLELDNLLACQNPLSSQHDEMLFVIIHQASELWMKLCLHELSAAMKHLENDALESVQKMLSRVTKIQGNMQQSWEILSTMTPADYIAFRDSLGQSSGFQSYQYREIEYRLGNKNASMAKVHQGSQKHYQHLQQILSSPSFYDLCLALLAKRGFDIPKEKLDRDWSQPYQACSKVEAAWLSVYRDTERYWDLYELAEKLVDLEHQFHSWRFAHMKTVERIIGYKPGTGGTGGVSYLVKALDLRFFPELWTLRTSL